MTVYTRPSPVPPRGFSLIELSIAMGLMSVLAPALGSAVALATRSMRISAEGARPRTSESARILEQLSADLHLALRFEEPLAPDEATFTVPDFDGDELPETIRWQWTGAPTFELTRLIDLSDEPGVPDPTVIASDVQEFDLSYLTRTWGPPPPPPLVESDELLIVHHDDEPGNDAPRVLFVVTNAGSPTLQELSREGLFAWWGWTVQRIGQTESPVAFDAAAAGADVAYISEDVDSTFVSTKLREASIGVVNEEVNLSDEFGLAESFGFPPPADLLSLDLSTHYITSAFVPGPVSLFSSPQAVTQLASVADDLSPALTALGRWDAPPALAILGMGDALAGEGAPATFGFDAIFGNQTSYSAFNKKHVATQVTLTSGATVTSLSAYLDLKKDKDIRFGIYADDAGEPGSLLAETDETERLAGIRWETVDLLEPVRLPAGTYWLAIGMLPDIAFFYDPVNGQTRYSDENPSNGLVEDWTGTYGPDPNERRISIRAHYTKTDFAAGRRVALPWGGNDFDIGSLTEDGKTLMRRSIEWAADLTPPDPVVGFASGPDDWPAQCFLPDLPSNAEGWKITSIRVAIRSDPDEPSGSVIFELRYAGVDGLPGSEVLQATAEIPSSTWDSSSFTWYQVPFNPISDLNPEVEVCLVVHGKDDDSAVVRIDRGGSPSSGTYLAETHDGGDSWAPAGANDDMRIYVYGTYTTMGPAQWP